MPYPYYSDLDTSMEEPLGFPPAASPSPATTPYYSRYQEMLGKGPPSMPQPGTKRRLLTAILGGLGGSLRGTPGAIPDAATERNTQRMLYGDYPERLGAWERETGLAGKAWEAENQLLGREIQAEQMRQQAETNRLTRQYLMENQRAQRETAWQNLRLTGMQEHPTAEPLHYQDIPPLPSVPEGPPLRYGTARPPFGPAQEPLIPPALELERQEGLPLPPVPGMSTRGPQIPAFQTIPPGYRPVTLPGLRLGSYEEMMEQKPEEQLRRKTEAASVAKFGPQGIEGLRRTLHTKAEEAARAMPASRQADELTTMKSGIDAALAVGDVDAAARVISGRAGQMMTKEASMSPEMLAFLKGAAGARIEGQQEAYGPEAIATFGRKLRTGEIRETAVPPSIRAAAIDFAGTLLTPKGREAIGDLRHIESIIGQIEYWSNQVNTSKGLVAAVTGAKQKAEAALQLNNAANMLKAQAGSLGTFARQISSERGVLTEGDVQRVAAMLPRLGIDTNLNKLLIAQMRDMVISRREAWFNPLGPATAMPSAVTPTTAPALPSGAPIVRRR